MSENTKTGEYSKSQNYIETDSNLNSGDIKINRSNIEQIEGTIFNIANDPERGWFLTVGHHIITEPKKTQSEALELLKKEMWDIIIKLILIVIDHEKEKDKIREAKING